MFPKNDVIGFDYWSQNPWDAKGEFSDFYDKVTKGYDSVIVIANSIGAFFTLLSLADKEIEKAFLISPIVDMKKLIQDMMQWAGVTIEELQDVILKRHITVGTLKCIKNDKEKCAKNLLRIAI